jgi:hypothetical protein
LVMGQKTTVKTPTTWGQSSIVIWPTFPSRGFTHGQMWWKSIFYHRICTRANGNPAHGACDLGSTSRMSAYAPCMSHKLKVYMDPIRVRVHHEANLWQTQRNLVGIGECEWVDDPRWLPLIPSYCLLGPKAQERQLVFAHKPNTFHSIMGLCSSW